MRFGGNNTGKRVRLKERTDGTILCGAFSAFLPSYRKDNVKK